MREHEVPTHVQAEDRVLLGFTFPQVVAVVAVCAISYGAYRYAPVGPSEVRMGIAVLFGLVGIAMVVGKIGGRRLPLVAADLLKYRLGARVYAGQIAQLVRAEPPAPAQPVGSGPGPVSLMAKRAGRGLARLRKKGKTRKNKERRNGRMRWFGKRRGKDAGRDQRHDHRAETLQSRRRKPRMGWIPVVALAVLMAAVVAVPQAALADDHEPWRDEIDFELTEPVEGRRIFVEGLTVSGDRAAVTLRAATNIDLRTRAYGGPEGTWLRFWGSATLDEGERVQYSLPLHGPAPSFTFSWEDGLGQAGAFTVTHEWIPHPLPAVEGELCDLRLVSLGWTPGAVSGVVESECVTSIEHPVELQTVAGHQSVTQTALMDAQVTAVTGTVSAATGASQTSVAFVPDGETRFTLPVGDGADIHAVTVDASLEASLRIPIPPLTVLTHHPERTEQVTRTVHLHRPGDSDSDSQTATATCEDGATASATATAYACDSPRLNARRFEEMVVGKIRSNVLTDGNIRALVKVVDEQMDGVAREQRKRLETIEDELEDVKRKLGRIWHFVETTDIDMADASDRIKEHRERQERLEDAAADARAILSQRRAVLDDVNTIAAYAQDMSEFLNESELTERRAFIETFVKEIVVMPGDALLRYTIPMPDDSPIPGRNAEEMVLNGSVLSTVKNGGAYFDDRQNRL